MTNGFKAIFVRPVSKHEIKMKAVAAVQRKLLEMIYTISKNQVPYNKNYLKEVETENKSMETAMHKTEKRLLK